MSAARRFKKKPVVIEAMEFTGRNHDEIGQFVGKPLYGTSASVIIPTLEGEMRANPGDWIIKGTHGEFYPIARHIFEENYEEVT